MITDYLLVKPVLPIQLFRRDKYFLIPNGVVKNDILGLIHTYSPSSFDK